MALIGAATAYGISRGEERRRREAEPIAAKEAQAAAWATQAAALKAQVEAGRRVDYVAEDIRSVLNSEDQRVQRPTRAKELRWLEKNAERYGYRLLGNSWLPPQ